MGCPSIYYKRALQCFAHALVYMEDNKYKYAGCIICDNGYVNLVNKMCNK